MGGDMLRSAVAAGSELGKQVKSIMDSGELVPDDLVNKIVAEQICGDSCKKGFVLDGYPRTVDQALFLDETLKSDDRKITHIIQLKVPDEELKVRILGRLIHKESGRTYHAEFNPPKQEMKDDVTGEPLIKRSDDNEESLTKRLKQFHDETAPVIQHYIDSNKDCVYEIDANCEPKEVWDKIRIKFNFGESVETLFEKLEAAESKSLLKKYLTKEIFEELKNKKTAQGCDFRSCIKSGIDNIDSGIGVYASDGDAYTVFADLLNPIIMDYHKLESLDDFKHPTQNFEFDDAMPADLDPDGKFIISTRVRVARNIEGYPLRGGMSEEQTNELEQKVKAILESFKDEDLKGKYYPLNNMDEKTRQQLVDDHFLFKKGDRFLESAGINNFWPNGRGIFFNDNKTFLVWVNEEDQLRIISMEQGANIKSVFGRLQKAVNAINEKLEFAYNEKLGYLTACPTNIGCGERASVHIKVPLTSQNEELFKEIATRNNLQIRGVHGEHSESKGGVYDVSNKRRLGISEWDGIKDLINGCRELIESETKLQKEANPEKNKRRKKGEKKGS